MISEIQYFECIPSIDDYNALFETTGWNEEYHFSKNELEEAVKNSWYIISAYHYQQLIGFGRVIADGIHHALIVDLIVHPEFQNNGIGSEILKRLVKKCKGNGIRDIQLFSAKGKSEFYEKFGFEKRPCDAPGMQLKHT